MDNVLNLELKTIIKADEPTLYKIYEKLAGPDQAALAALLKETLVAAGLPETFAIELQPGHPGHWHKEGSGLNAWEWLENENQARPVEMRLDQND